MFACSEGFEEFLFVKSRVFISKFHVRNIQGIFVRPERSGSNIVVLSVKNVKLRLLGR